MTSTDVVVVGAGLSGLVAATSLREEGRDVVVLEQQATPGGRLATRRLAGATLDHGAQFFTTRHERFVRLVESWRAAGIGVRKWSDGFAQSTSLLDGPRSAKAALDGYPRYVVDGGMQQLGVLLAQGVDVLTRTRVESLESDGKRWRVRCSSSGGTVVEIDARTVVLTPPGPLARALLPSGVGAEHLRTFRPTLALLVVLDRPPALPEPGGVQFTQGPVQWMADNAAKGISAQPALTVHLAEEPSTALFTSDDETVRRALWSDLEPWFGGAHVVATAVERWRFAGPHGTHDEHAVKVDVDGAPLVLAGDAFAGPKVEGAALSGLVAADLC